MANLKPLLTSLPDQIGRKFQRLPPIFGDGGFNGAITDVGRQPEIAMAAYKPKVAITQERHEISDTFQRILYIFDHCYFWLSADIGDGTVETAVSENMG